MRLLPFLSRHRIVLTVTLLLFAVPAWAGDLPLDRATLKGVEEFTVIVEPIDPEIENAGVTSAQIRTDVELRLRHAGIRIVDRFPSLHLLHVAVHTMKAQGTHLYVFALDVAFEQEARLTRNSAIFVARPLATWSVQAFGTIGADNLRDLRSTVIDYVGRFINAYLEQNSKQ